MIKAIDLVMIQLELLADMAQRWKETEQVIQIELAVGWRFFIWVSCDALFAFMEKQVLFLLYPTFDRSSPRTS